jgi:hypothetical protein
MLNDGNGGGTNLAFMPCLRRVLLAFIRQLDIPYSTLFSCPVCTPKGPEQLTIIADAKAMGMNKTLAKPYVPPSACRGTDTVHIAWYIFFIGTPS